MKFLSAKTDEQFSQGVLHRNSVCGVDRGIAAVACFAHGELWIETNGNVTRMSGAPGWSRAATLPHQREMSPSFCTQRRQFEFLPPWWLALGAPVGCFARRPATESATKSVRVIRLADGAVSPATRRCRLRRRRRQEMTSLHPNPHLHLRRRRKRSAPVPQTQIPTTAPAQKAQGRPKPRSRQRLTFWSARARRSPTG